MVWGTFTTTHIVSLILGVMAIIALYFVLKLLNQKTQIIVLGILSFAGIASIVYRLIAWDAPLEYLPLELCSLNAMMLPFAVFTRNKRIGNLLLLWSVGALAALILNTSVAQYEITSDVFIGYYYPHVLEFGIPILLFALGLVKLDKKCIWSTTVITFASYIVIHFINLAVNDYCIANHVMNRWNTEVLQVNYMFSIHPAGNPLLKFFWSIIPYSFWYMFLCVFVVIIYLGIIYFAGDLYKFLRYGKKIEEKGEKENLESKTEI